MSSANLALTPLTGSRVEGRVDPHGWGYALLLPTIGALLFRPSELIPALEGLPIYQCLIIACALVSLRSLYEQLSFKSLVQQPLTCCLILMFFAVVASHFMRGMFWEARYFGWQFTKLIILYLLVVGLIHTPQRLFTFVKFMVCVIATIATLALLDRYGIVHLATVEAVQDSYNSGTDNSIQLQRLRWAGIFHDPNDLALILVTAIVFCTFLMTKPGLGALRYLWGIPLVLMLLTLMETHSRGGFLSMLAVIPAWAMHRHGFRQSLVALAIAIPLMVLVFAGRMTQIDSVIDGTGQSRVQIWSDTLIVFQQSPIFGVGQGMLVDEIGAVCHNSFLHAFSEIGVIGGTLFVGVFLAGAAQLGPFGGEPITRLSELDRFRTYCFAAVTGYVVGLTTLSREFVGPTYLLLGLVSAVYCIRGTKLSRAWLVTGDLLPRAFVVSSLVLLLFYLAIRILVRW